MAKKILDYPIYLFNEGTNFEAHKMMKISYVVKSGKKMWRFRCYAPNARSVSIVGDFNNWDRNTHKMSPVGGGIWEGYAQALKKFDNYKFSVEQSNGRIVNKADPYALHTETPPATASKIYDISGYNWKDAEYMEKRRSLDVNKQPLNIYEMHLGSWKRHDDGNYYSYRDIADNLVP